MTSPNNAAANAAPAAESVNVSKPARKHPRTSSEAHKKPARSLPSSTSRKKACQTASAKVPTAIDASDTVPEQRRQTKASVVEALLTREGRASLEALCEATGWQPHTCRAFLTGLRKKGREVIRASDKDGKSIYLMASDRSAASPKAKQTEAESN